MNRFFSILKQAFEISRFRFWLYLGGTYMLGYIIGATSLNQFVKPQFVLHLIYFLIPANVFLYGINDLADQDTDQFNPKKGTREQRIENSRQEQDLKIILLIITILSIAMLLFQSDQTSRVLFMLFVALSFGYSYPPLRFKGKPFIDFSSNILYALPGILAYYQVSQQLPPLAIWLALYLWTGAMHLFSSIPDIEADRQAGVITTSVYLGRTPSLWICTIFWAISFAIIVFGYSAFVPWSYVIGLYPLIPLSLLWNKYLNINRIYWLYPYINGLLGLLLSLLSGWDLVFSDTPLPP